MHEAGIAQSIIDIALETAQKNGSLKILSVAVNIGRLVAVENESLWFAFDALKEDTILKDSKLIINDIDITGKCLDCGDENIYEEYFFACKKCGSYNVRIITGEELNVTEIEVE